jgi:hypothetical protein
MLCLDILAKKKTGATKPVLASRKSYIGQLGSGNPILWNSLTEGDDLPTHWKKFTVIEEQKPSKDCSVVFWFVACFDTVCIRDLSLTLAKRPPNRIELV